MHWYLITIYYYLMFKSLIKMKGLTVSLFILSGVQGSFAQEIEVKKDTLEIQSQDPS